MKSEIFSMLRNETHPNSKPDSHFALYLYSYNLKRKEELEMRIKQNKEMVILYTRNTLGSDLAIREDSSRRISNFKIKGDALDERIPLIGWGGGRFPPLFLNQRNLDCGGGRRDEIQTKEREDEECPVTSSL